MLECMILFVTSWNNSSRIIIVFSRSKINLLYWIFFSSITFNNKELIEFYYYYFHLFLSVFVYSEPYPRCISGMWKIWWWQSFFLFYYFMCFEFSVCHKLVFLYIFGLIFINLFYMMIYGCICRDKNFIFQGVWKRIL